VFRQPPTLVRDRPCIGIEVAETARSEQGISGFEDKLHKITAAANALNLFHCWVVPEGGLSNKYPLATARLLRLGKEVSGPTFYTVTITHLPLQ